MHIYMNVWILHICIHVSSRHSWPYVCMCMYIGYMYPYIQACILAHITLCACI